MKRTILIALAACAASLASGSATAAPPTTVAPNCSDTQITWQLDPARDYRIRLGRKPRRCMILIRGGHNVTIKGGEIRIPWQHDTGHELISNHYGIYLADQTGTVRVEGVRLGGPDMLVPIALSEGSGASVIIRHVRAVLHSHWSNIENAHGECIQSWRGPKVLDVDYFTCGTDYFFLQLSPVHFVCGSRFALPNCDSAAADIPTRFSFAHMNSFNSNRRRDSTRFAFWWDDDGVKDPLGRPARWPMTFRSVYAHVARGRSCRRETVVWPRAPDWPNCSSWPPFHRGQPPHGDFVPASSDVGIHYGGA